MVTLAYNLFIYGYYLVIKLATFFSPKARLWVNGRKETFDIIKQSNLKNCIWLHASSLGEFEQISYLIEQIKKRYPNEKILVSFFSPSGYEIKKNFSHADVVVYLPFDFKARMDKFIEIIDPKLVFWVRYEFWLNTLASLNEKNIPTYLLNAVFRENTSIFYKPILTKALSYFTKIYVISEQSKVNLEKLGFDSDILYDTRYDRMAQVVQMPFVDNIIQTFAKNEKLVICGSTWKSDDDVISKTINSSKDIQWILIPHEINKERIEQLCEIYPEAQLYTDYDPNNKTKILIVNTMGYLSKIYRYADAIYVGGGFGKVVHSIVEPLAYSLPIIVGKNIAKSEEASEFVHHKLVKQIINSRQFNQEVYQILSQDNLPENKRKRKIFVNRQGSVDKLLAIVSEKFRTLGS